MDDTSNGSGGASAAFKNDGSFLEQFMKLQQKQQSPEPVAEKREPSPVPSSDSSKEPESSDKPPEEKRTTPEPSDAKKPGPFSKFAKKAPFAGSVRVLSAYLFKALSVLLAEASVLSFLPFSTDLMLLA